jgi:aspartate/methionine/tyrosine aminotransferase
MASAGSLCCTVRDIFELDLDDRSILDSSFGPKLEKETKERIIEINRYEGLSSEDLLFTANSCSQAIDTVIKALVEPGDEVITTVPNWPQYAEGVAEEKMYIPLPHSGTQAKVEMLKLDMEDGWAYPMEEFKEKISSNTKLVIAQTPGHNPTGNNFDIEVICELAEEAGAYVLHDDIFRGLELDAPFSTPAAVSLYDKAVAVNSLSKTIGLEGLRLGWIATGNKDLMRRCEEIAFWAKGKQHFMTQIVYHVHEPSKYMKILEEKRKIQEESWFIVSQWIKSNSDVFEWVPPEAAYIAFPKFNLDIDSYSLFEKLLNEYRVLIIPGICYGFDDHIRIGVGKSTTANIASGLIQLDKCIDSFR